ncbi:diguanylate cyclase domain-containing protein [Vibrio metschnikovii]
MRQLDSDLDIASKRADLLCRKILDTLSKPYYIDNIEHFSTLSIGVTLFLGETKGIDELLKHADLAMYQAKGAGRNTHRFFNPEM